MRMPKRRGLAVVGAAAILATALAACNSNNNTSSGSSGGNGASVSQGFKIGLLLPESETARYESPGPAAVRGQGQRALPDCEVLYQNADQDAAKQQSQAEAALTQGAKVLVLDPVDATSAAGMVDQRPAGRTSR